MMIGRVIPIGKSLRLKAPVSFEIIRPRPLFAAPKIKDLKSLPARKPHELPVHKIIRSKLEIFFESASIVWKNLVAVEKSQYCRNGFLITPNDKDFNLFAE